jgi:hypothetical protein
VPPAGPPLGALEPELAPPAGGLRFCISLELEPGDPLGDVFEALDEPLLASSPLLQPYRPPAMRAIGRTTKAIFFSRFMTVLRY